MHQGGRGVPFSLPCHAAADLISFTKPAKGSTNGAENKLVIMSSSFSMSTHGAGAGCDGGAGEHAPHAHGIAAGGSRAPVSRPGVAHRDQRGGSGGATHPAGLPFPAAAQVALVQPGGRPVRAVHAHAEIPLAATGEGLLSMYACFPFSPIVQRTV